MKKIILCCFFCFIFIHIVYPQEFSNDSKFDRQIKLALIVPQNYNDDVKKIIQGIKFYKNNRLTNREINVEIFEANNDDSIKLSSIAKKLKKENYTCIIGPVFSEKANIFVKSLKPAKLPIFSPTINNSTKLNDKNFYCLNVTYEQQGKSWAQYIYNYDLVKRIVIINSATGKNPQIKKPFAKKFQELGGKIIKEYKFVSNKTSIDKIINEIKNSKEEIDGLVFFSKDPDEAAGFIDILSSNQITLPMYVNDQWIKIKNYNLLSKLYGDVKAFTEFYIDKDDNELFVLNQEFNGLYNVNLTGSAMYGYDLMKYLFESLKIDENKILWNVDIVEGKCYHNDIKIKNNLNTSINILQLNDGKFIYRERYKTE